MIVTTIGIDRTREPKKYKNGQSRTDHRLSFFPCSAVREAVAQRRMVSSRAIP